MEKMLAFQTVDVENDIWCNNALLFKTEGDAIHFFNDLPLIFRTLQWELGEDETFNAVSVEKFYTHGHDEDNEDNLVPNTVIIECWYAGEQRFAQMSGGFVIG